MNDRELLLDCLRQIEKRLEWGSSDQWTNNEYNKLSTLIEEKTKIVVSTSTLRRLFSMLNSGNLFNPQSETKNALAGFLDYKNWAGFIESKNQPEVDHRIAPKKNKRIYRIAAISIFTIISAIVIIILNTGKHKSYNLSKIHFEGENLTGKKIPHTVLITYDLSAYPDDQFFIDFSETDPSGINSVPEKLTSIKGQISHTYRIKSIFKIKLLDAQNNILKILPVHIFTDGWEAYVSQEETTFFYDSSQIIHQGLMSISKENLSQRIDTLDIYRTFFRNITDFPVSGDNVDISMKLKGSFRRGLVECPHVQFELIGDSSRCFLTFMNPGCYGNIKRIAIAKSSFSGNKNNLSGLEMDLEKWNKLNIILKNHLLKIFLNDSLSFEYKYEGDIGNLKSIRYEFRGQGFVDYFYISDSETRKKIYHEDF